jgi:TRAP transporter TAXI family solute receptor
MDTFEDLKGKRVYVGAAGSSRRDAMEVLMEAHGWTGEEVTDVSTFEGANLAEALCDGEFDAFVYTIGHPNPTVREAATLCDIKLVDVSSSIIKKLARQNPFYISSMIKGDTYRGNLRDTPTLGATSMLATSAKVDPNVIYQVTKAYFENLKLLQALSPLFLSLTQEQMAETDLDIPFHEGALKYFSEVGLRGTD